MNKIITYTCPYCGYQSNEDHEVCPACGNGESVSYNNEQKGFDQEYLQSCIDKASKSWKGVDVDKFMDEVRGREPVCEGLDDAINAYIAPRLDKVYEHYGEHRQKQLSKFNAYDLEEAIEYGAKWMREKMMKDAVEGYVTLTLTGVRTVAATIKEEDNIGFGDKVRVIVLPKED